MKEGVYLIGAFHEMIELLEDLEIPIVGMIDRREHTDDCSHLYKVLGDDEWLKALGPQKGKTQLVVSPDSPKLREKLVTEYGEIGFIFPTIIGGKVSRYAQLGEGTVIQKDAYVSAGCQLGRGVKVNIGAKVMHDASIGDFSTIAPSAVILGNVIVGKGSYVGSNATILPHVNIGEGAVVGAGAVVTKDVTPYMTVKGVPAC
jgi:sugar O-acyltransferase (sialic acid O-acetyltransferase NeuD family)